MENHFCALPIKAPHCFDSASTGKFDIFWWDHRQYLSGGDWERKSVYLEKIKNREWELIDAKRQWNLIESSYFKSSKKSPSVSETVNPDFPERASFLSTGNTIADEICKEGSKSQHSIDDILGKKQKMSFTGLYADIMFF